LYLGDANGFVSVWDLSQILDQCKIEKQATFLEYDLQFYPNRSEKIDVSSYAHMMKKGALAVDPESYEKINPHKLGIVLMEAKAYQSSVTSITYSQERNTLFSCCNESRVVTLWDPLTMDIEGVID
jgi:uncharacterized protein YjiK